MSCSKLSSTEIPISVRLKIPKEKLLSVRQEKEWAIKSEDLNIDELDGVTYRVGLCSSEFVPDYIFIGQCLFVYLGVTNKRNLKMNVDYEVSIPSANYIGKKGECGHGEDHLYFSIIGQPDLFDPRKSFIVNDNLIIVMEATLCLQKEESDDAGSFLKASKCCECGLGSIIYEHDDKDFAFIVEEQEIKVHKFVVGAKSSVFRRMFECGMKESMEGKVTIIDFNFETVATALKFCYGIEEHKLWTLENAVDLLRFAEKYDINDLKALMETFLSSQISPTNVCKIANASILGNAIKLHEECFEYLFKCNQNKISVSDLDLLDKDFAVKLTKASFSRFPMLQEKEEPSEDDEEDETPPIRKPFVKKVAGIVTLMLISCYLIVAFLITSSSIQELWGNICPCYYRTLFSINEIAMIALSFIIDVIPAFRQRSPDKWIIISAITGIAGFMISICISHFTVTSVISAFVFTLFVSAFLILYASFTRMDYTDFRVFILGFSALLDGYAIFSTKFPLIPVNSSAIFQQSSNSEDYVGRLFAYSPRCWNIARILDFVIFLFFTWFPQIYYLLCALVTMFAFVMNVQHSMGTFELLVAENEPCHSGVTVFQNIFQMFIFILGVFGGGDGFENFIPYVSVGLGPTLFYR